MESPSGAFVARDNGTPIGLAYCTALQDEWFLSECFVEPSYRRMGIGTRLLQAAMREAGDVARSALVPAEERGGFAFALRNGIALQTPVLRIAGAIPREEHLAQMAAGDYRFRVETIDPVAHRFALDALDREIRGSARPADHVQWARDATGACFILQDEVVGYAHVWPDGRIGPAASASNAYLVQFLGFALVTLRRTYGASWCTAMVPGNNLRVMRTAVRIGLAIDGTYLFATDTPMNDLTRYVGFHALSF